LTSAIEKRNALGKDAAHTIGLAGSLSYDITSWIRYIYCQREKITGKRLLHLAVEENHPITANDNRGLEGGSVRIRLIISSFPRANQIDPPPGLPTFCT
jgi:hypothetical protein